MRVLQSQIAMTPRGAYRTALEQHLRQTRDHAERVGERLQELGHGGIRYGRLRRRGDRRRSGAGLDKTPFDLLRGSGGEEKVLKNAKDAYASEALEIATYTAIERLASAVGDEQTAKLAASIRADEQKMLERVLTEIPKLTDAVVRADVKGNPSYDVTTTGAADAVRDAGEAAKDAARTTSARAKRTARQARKVPGVAQAEGQIKGAVASEGDLAIARYDALTAEEIVGQARRALPDRPGQDRLLRAQEPEPHHGPRPHHHAARQRAVGRLRRADRGRGAGRPRRGRRRPRRAGPLLRAQPQEPRRRPEGRRARARQRLSSWMSARAQQPAGPSPARWYQKPSWRSTADSLVLACSFTVRVTSWWPRLMVTL